MAQANPIAQFIKHQKEQAAAKAALCSVLHFSLTYFADTGHLVMYGNNNNHDDNGNMVSSTTSGGGAITDLTLYIVFGVALVVFILVIIIIVKILKRKNPNPNGYTLTSTGK